MKVKMRSIRPEDIMFIKSTWLDHQAGQKYFKKCPRRIIKEHLGKYVDARLERSLTLILCAEEDENQIIGYIVYDCKTIHFAYVKLLYRNFGMFKLLIRELKSTFDCYSSCTDDRNFQKFIKDNKLIFNPWA